MTMAEVPIHTANIEHRSRARHVHLPVCSADHDAFGVADCTLPIGADRGSVCGYGPRRGGRADSSIGPGSDPPLTRQSI